MNIQSLEQDYINKMPYKEMQKKYGMSTAAIRWALKDSGILRTRKSRQGAWYDEQAIAMLRSGMSPGEIVCNLGLGRSSTHIYDLARKNGISIVDRWERDATEKKITIERLMSDGNSMEEISEISGYSINTILRFRPDWSKGCNYYKGRAGDDEAIREWLARYTDKWEYVSGYKSCDEPILIRCKICGHEQWRNGRTIRGDEIRCEACYQKQFDKKKEEQKIQAEKKKISRQIAKDKRAIQLQLGISICSICGDVISETNKKFCANCVETKRKSRESLHKDKRLRKLNEAIIDKDITLEKLYDRDSGVCHICGTMCEWDDYQISKGRKQCGNNYPSIDHVIPLAKGGEHSWNNIKLAHRVCNSIKGDSIAITLPPPDAI